MNDEKAMQIVSECMSDTTPLTINFTIADAWLLLSGIQLATRHPELSVYMKDSLFESGLKFQEMIEAVHPEAHEFIEMGWDKRFDGVDSLDDVLLDEFGDEDDGEYQDDEDLDDEDWNDPYPANWFDPDMDIEPPETPRFTDIGPGSENSSNEDKPHETL